MEWVPREEDTLADELSKLLIPDDSMLSNEFFRKLEERFGPHSVDLFASGVNSQCKKFYSLHGCRGTACVNALAFDWGGVRLYQLPIQTDWQGVAEARE